MFVSFEKKKKKVQCEKAVKNFNDWCVNYIYTE